MEDGIKRATETNSPVDIIEFKKTAQQHIGAVLNVLWSRELLRCMADAADTRDENHPDGSEPRHVLRIVTGAGGQQFRRQAEFASSFGD